MGMTRGGGEGRNELYNHVLQMFIRSQAYVSKGEYPHHPCYHRQKATLLAALRDMPRLLLEALPVKRGASLMPEERWRYKPTREIRCYSRRS